MAEPFVFHRQARDTRGLAMAATALIVLLILIFVIAAHPIIVAVFALAISPALWEIYRNAETALAVTDDHIAWRTGKRTGEIPLEQIDIVRLRTSLDFSQRATVVLNDGKKIRLPMECLPGGRRLDHVLEIRGIPHSRSLFGG